LKHGPDSRKSERKKKSQKGNENGRDFALEQGIFTGAERKLSLE